MQYLFNGTIPDIRGHLTGARNPDTLQEEIRRLIAGYRACDAALARFGTAADACAELARFISAMQTALDAAGGPPIALMGVPDDVLGAWGRTTARMIAAAQSARDDLLPYLPTRGGQPAPRHLDIVAYRMIETLQAAGVKAPTACTARILETCEVPAPRTAAGITAACQREQKRIPGRRVIQF